MDSVRVASKGDQEDGDKRRGRGQEGPGLAAWDPAAWDGYLALGFLGKATKPLPQKNCKWNKRLLLMCHWHWMLCCLGVVTTPV